MPRRVNLGWFNLGERKVKVLYDPKLAGGEFSAHQIVIGGHTKNWPHTVATAAHEALEMAFSQQRCRWVPDVDMAAASDGFLFVADHAQFSEAAAQAGQLLAKLLPELSRAFKENK